MTYTFKQAAESYLTHGGEARYLPKIIEYFGDKKLTEIFPFDIRQMADEIYPDHSGATKNRQAITPTRAVMHHGYDRGWCNLMRIKRFKVDKPKIPKSASPTWLHIFVRQCDRDKLFHLSAIVLFMASTGARISEAIALNWNEVDFQAKTALLLKTKTSTNSIRYLTDEVLTRLQNLKQKSKSDRVFKYKCRHSVNERIFAVCERAEIPYISPHNCGRRTFATRAIELGMDVKTTMIAGGWESSTVFLETYVQVRKNAGKMIADRFSLDDFGSI